MIPRFARRTAWLTMTLVLLSAHTALAAKTLVYNVRVDNMHCADCAKKIARKLYTVPGVVRVKTNLQAHTATVTPEAGKHLSPRALWDAVEKSGFKPVLLEAPQGKFKARPTK